jgi:hypothetical protein
MPAAAPSAAILPAGPAVAVGRQQAAVTGEAEGKGQS